MRLVLLLALLLVLLGPVLSTARKCGGRRKAGGTSLRIGAKSATTAFARGACSNGRLCKGTSYKPKQVSSKKQVKPRPYGSLQYVKPSLITNKQNVIQNHYTTIINQNNNKNNYNNRKDKQTSVTSQNEINNQYSNYAESARAQKSQQNPSSRAFYHGYSTWGSVGKERCHERNECAQIGSSQLGISAAKSNHAVSAKTSSAIKTEEKYRRSQETKQEIEISLDSRSVQQALAAGCASESLC